MAVAAGLLGTGGLLTATMADFGSGVPAAVGAPREVSGSPAAKQPSALKATPPDHAAGMVASGGGRVTRLTSGRAPAGSRVARGENAVGTAEGIENGITAGGDASAARNTSKSTIVVRGSWVNDGQCLPTALKGGPTTFDITCTGTSQWDGALTGREVAHIVGTIDVEGNMSANYEAWFTGTYIVDHTVGGFHEFGTVAVDGATLGFQAHARVVSGSCSFAGSTGRFDFDGNAETGGYTGTWTRPAVPPATSNPCVPDIPAVK